MLRLIENTLTRLAKARDTFLGLHPATLPTDPDGLHRVGVWVGRAGAVNPKRAVRDMVRLGATDCYCMVNELSRHRLEVPFSFYGGAVDLADACHAAGIRFHITTWILPHRGFLSSMCLHMPGLIERTGAASVMFDAEEPWTLSRRHQGWKAAAKMLRGIMDQDPWGVPLGITGIGYASTRKLKPLADLCDYLTPQAYSTRTSKLDCRNVARKFVNIWARKFGDKEQRVGLAAYRQRGVKGSDGTELDAMLKAIASVPPEVDEVIFWYLPTLRMNERTAQALLKLRTVLDDGNAFSDIA